jgi:hypothetical protein
MMFGKTKSALLMAVLAIVLSFAGVRPFTQSQVSAAQLGTRFLELGDSAEGASGVTYDVSFKISTAGTLGSIEIEFCSNSTFPSDPCTAPIGLDASGVVFSQETGVGGFSVSPASTQNDIILTRPPSPTSAVTATLRFDNIANPTNAGSYYVRVLTYPTNDATGSPTDTGGMAFAINSAVNVSVEVPPYLLFCTGNTITGSDCSNSSGDFIDLGGLSSNRTSSGQSQMGIATNGKNGYSISVTGTTLTSGNNTIPALTADSAPRTGVSQFGINLRKNANPSVGANPTGGGTGAPTANYDQPNLYKYGDGDVVATNASVEEYRQYTVSYVVDISKSQPAGIYASTFTYVAFANF